MHRRSPYLRFTAFALAKMEELQEQVRQLQEQNQLLSQQMQLHQGEQQQQFSTLPQAQQVSTNINRVSVKLPVFWPDKPAVWFAQAEAQFSVAGITQDATKYAYVVSQLDSRYAAEVEDIIINPPQQNAYVYLRAELIRRLSTSEEQRVRQLLMEEQLGDRKPSQFLRHLRSLAGTTQVQDNLLRQLWSQRLPPQIQAILQTQGELPLDQVAVLADKIMEVTQNAIPTSVNAVTTAPANEIAALSQRMEELTKQVAELQSSLRRRSRSRRRTSSSRGSSPAAYTNTNTTGICWYHMRYGEQARKCVTPCSFPSNSNGNQ